MCESVLRLGVPKAMESRTLLGSPSCEEDFN